MDHLKALEHHTITLPLDVVLRLLRESVGHLSPELDSLVHREVRGTLEALKLPRKDLEWIMGWAAGVPGDEVS